ncbi:hypothetical protein CEXT_477371, partial [Caerostris extrusa]
DSIYFSPGKENEKGKFGLLAQSQFDIGCQSSDDRCHRNRLL